MNKQLLAGMSLAFLLGTSARADLHQGHTWLQGPQSAGFGFAKLDVDDESGQIGVMVDFQNLSSPLVQGRLVGTGGATLCTIAPQAASPGFAFGAGMLTPAEVMQLISGQASIALDTVAYPQGEVFGPMQLQGESFSFPVSPSQVAPAHTSPAHGTGYAFLDLFGAAGFSGQLHDLQGTVSSIEIWREAWYGQTGKLMLKVTAIGHPSATLTTYSASLAATTLEERRELRDGMCYVIVRTSLFPDGEMRGQIRAPWLGDEYCSGRPNSVSTIGARLSFVGSPLASANAVQLQATNLPPGKVVLPIVGFGTAHSFSPSGLSGVLCVGGAGIGRLSSALGVSSSQGGFSAQLDLSSFSVGGIVHSLQPDMRLNLQLWYRDPQGPTPSNFSSAVSAVFH